MILVSKGKVSQSMKRCSGEEKFLSDEQLAVAAAAGDEVSRIRLIGRYIPLVKSRVSGYADGGFEPEDLAQEGMIGLMQAIDAYRVTGGASFRTFALLCIDRSIISVVRSALGAKKIPVGQVVPLEDREDSFIAGETPQTIVESKDSFRWLLSKLSGVLSGLEQQAFLLYLGGCEYEEIATRLGVPQKTVDNALCRARRKIKQLDL